MNTWETTRIEYYYNNNPDSVTLTVTASGATCKGLFDESFVAGSDDLAGVQDAKLRRHFVTYIGNNTIFASDPYNTAVTIGSDTYHIHSIDKLETQGALQIWLV